MARTRLVTIWHAVSVDTARKLRTTELQVYNLATIIHGQAMLCVESTHQLRPRRRRITLSRPQSSSSMSSSCHSLTMASHSSKYASRSRLWPFSLK